MASVSTYLNFPRSTKVAFDFYKSVFGGEFGGARIMRFGDIPQTEGTPKTAYKDKNLIRKKKPKDYLKLCQMEVQ